MRDVRTWEKSYRRKFNEVGKTSEIKMKQEVRNAREESKEV